jgi:hypothetical protein
MKIPEGGSYDPETITLLRTVLDAAWDALLPEHQARTSKAHLAQRMLKLAAQGERDPIRLRTRALIEIAPYRSGAAMPTRNASSLTPT